MAKDKVKWVDEHWDEFLSDLETLVSINSERDDATASDSCPWGEGPALALEEALKIAKRMGFQVTNLENTIGYADFQGEGESQVAMIGHVDVVPAGSGWKFPPYALTKSDGYLIGRGVIDDKGPLLACMYAAKYCAEQGELPHTLRVIVGTNEETGMADLDVYFRNCEVPEFLFTPDADWPLIYGEKGVYRTDFVSEEIKDGNIIEWQGGSATNAVPDFATALLRVGQGFSLSDVNVEEGVEVTLESEDTLRIVAKGKSAHASRPETGISAIKKLARCVLDNDLLAACEKPFVELAYKLSENFDGSGVGIEASGEHFDALTIIAGEGRKAGNRMFQSVNIRYPETVTCDEITETLSECASELHATLENVECFEPYLADPNDLKILELFKAYSEVTGDIEHKPRTVGSGSYARHFQGAVSYGILKNWEVEEPWVGKMHAPNEAVKEADLKEALLIYITALQNLAEIRL